MSARCRDVRDIGRPHVIGSLDREAAEKIGIDLVVLATLAQVRLWKDGLETKSVHQACGQFAADLVAQGA